MNSPLSENWIFSESLAFLPGLRHQSLSHREDINQLYAHSGAMKQSPRPARAGAFAPNRIETAEHLSKLTGAIAPW